MSIETAALIVLGGVGIALTYFGYEAARALLRYGGLATGAAVGGWLGLGVLPRVFTESLTSAEVLGIAALLCVIGAGIGLKFIPRLGRLAVGVLGFTVTAVAALVVFSEGRTMEIITQTTPRAIERRNPDLLFDRLGAIEFAGGLDPQLALAAVLFVAALGGGLAISYKWVILSAGVTVIGALLLAVVVPLFFIGGVPGDGAVTESLSRLWFGVFLATGLGFEFARHSEALELNVPLGG